MYKFSRTRKNFTMNAISQIVIYHENVDDVLQFCRFPPVTATSCLPCWFLIVLIRVRLGASELGNLETHPIIIFDFQSRFKGKTQSKPYKVNASFRIILVRVRLNGLELGNLETHFYGMHGPTIIFYLQSRFKSKNQSQP